MARSVEFADDRLIVHLSGATMVEALQRRLEIPYSAITAVSTDPFVAPPGTLRVGGTSIPFTDVREGHFLHGGEWYFLSYEDRHRTVTLDLEGHRYRKVVIGAADPATLAREMEARREAH